MYIRKTTAPFLAALAAGVLVLVRPVTSHAEVVGWNNDGSGSFPDARPPVVFDGASGTNVKWKAKLPNWSNSSPIVVDADKGPRVILVAEPLDYAPLLLCFDADTGRELWRRELDAVPFLPDAERAEAREVAKRGWAAARLRKALTAEIATLAKDNRDAWKDKNNLPAEAAPILEKAKAAGLHYTGLGSSAGGYANYIHPVGGGQFARDHRRLTELGLMWSSWDYQGTWDGVAYPSPISDGKRIWTVTMHNLYSCHDVDGNVVWQVRFPPPKPSDLTPEQKGRLTDKNGRCGWPYGWPGQGHFSTSPLMVDGKLVSMAGAMVRCLDATTGKVLWAEPLDGNIGQNMAVPGVVTLGGERYIVTATGEGRIADGDSLHRVRDGKRVGVLPGIASSKGGNSGPVIHGDIVVNWPSHGEGVSLTAHRMEVHGDTVTCEPVWPSSPKSRQVNLFRPCWRDGKLYNANGTILDLANGTLNPVGRPRHGGGYAGDGCLLIGDSLFSWDFYKGSFVWSDIRTGAKLGEGVLPVNPADGHSLAFKREQACLDEWRWLTAATPFAYKDRLYIRAYDFLWCIAPAYTPGEAAKRVAAAGAAGRMTMAKEDPSLEVRAAAIRALGTGAGQEGCKALRESMIAVSATGQWQHRHTAGGERLQLALLLRALGADAEPSALSILQDGDAKTRETIAAAILWGDLPRAKTLRDALIPLFVERKISDELAASALAVWPKDTAVTATFTKLLNDGKFRNAQPAMFDYLLPLQPADQVLGFLARVAVAAPHDNVRGNAIGALIERRAFDVLAQMIESATGRQQGALLWPLCHAVKTPEAKAFAVAQMKKKLEAKAKPEELGIGAWSQLGADAGPLLPLLKALNPDNATVKNTIADIERKVAEAVKK